MRKMTMTRCVKIRNPSDEEAREIRNARRRAKRYLLRGPLEDQIQADFVEWARTCPDILLIWHTPNERSSKKQRIRLARLGVLPGIPDILLILRNGTHVAIELKARHGVVSRAQYEVMCTLEQAGWKTAVCRSAAAARAVVEGLV